jgi:sugar lactone lactonase YvrE
MSELTPVETGSDRLGEGPVWSSPDAVLWWVDITGHAVRRLDPRTGELQRYAMPSDVGCAVPSVRGDLLVALRDGIHRFDPASGELTQVADPEPDLNTGFNDGKVDPRGRFWCGTYDLDEARPLGSLYRLDQDGTLTRQVEGVIESNGLDWSPDATAMYYTDSGARTITVYDFDIDTGTIENGRLFAHDDDCTPDGLAVDAEGYVWSAKWDGWRIVRYAPDGRVDRVLELPVQRPTSLAFGGPDLEDLYVTTAWYDFDEATRAAQPLAGRLLMGRVGVRGRDSVPYGG